MIRTYTIVGEPRGETYRRLLRWAAQQSVSALLVVRPEEELGESGMRVLARLHPNLREEELTSEWPGTRLLDGVARVRFYTLSSATLETLCEEASSLFSWEQPDLPEDLCFLRDSGPLLVTISHERDAYLLIDEEQARDLQAAVPALRLDVDEVASP